MNKNLPKLKIIQKIAILNNTLFLIVFQELIKIFQKK